MSQKIYNTIIIGAGPAGLTAGKNLFDNFLILEKKKEIGKPVQCIGMSVESFKRHNLNENIESVKSKIYKIERITPNGKKIGRLKEKHIGYVVKRESFEKYLSKDIEPYIKTDVNVINILQNNNGLWEIITENGSLFKSKYVIGADGINSIIRTKIFPEAQKNISLAFGLEYSIKFSNKIDLNSIKFYLDNEIYSRGYGWFFPTSNYTANIGVGSENKNLKFDEIIKKTIEKNKKQYGDYEIIDKTSGFTGSIINFFPLFRKNIFLVGDAAGLNDPIFRAGTNQAMISAQIASQCILNNNPHEYSNKIKSLPFLNRKIKKSSNIFYGFSNELLNEIGNILENKSFSETKKLFIFIKLLKNKKIRQNIFKIIYFIKTWVNFKNWLW